MPRLGEVDESGQVVGMVPNDQVAEMIGTDPAQGYTNPEVAARMVEMVADSANLVLLGDPDMFSEEVLQVVGPYLVDADEATTGKFYGEEEGTPLSEEPTVTTTETMAADPMTGTESYSTTTEANLGDAAEQVTQEQLNKLLSGGEDRDALYDVLSDMMGGRNAKG